MLTCCFSPTAAWGRRRAWSRIPYGAVLTPGPGCCIRCNSAPFHPGLVAVPEPVRGKAGLDREPAGEWGALRDGLDASSTWREERRGIGPGGRPHGDRDARPDRGIGDNQ